MVEAKGELCLVRFVIVWFTLRGNQNVEVLVGGGKVVVEFVDDVLVTDAVQVFGLAYLDVHVLNVAKMKVLV